MARIVPDSEMAYVNRRLRPVVAALRDDRALRNDFLTYAMVRGGDLMLNAKRLEKTWQASRRPQYAPFFVLLLAEFAFRHRLLRFAAAHSRTRSARRTHSPVRRRHRSSGRRRR